MTSQARSAPAVAIEWAQGAAWIDGTITPIAEARIPITDWAYRRSDVTYDVVSVWGGMFFRLDDHLRRFRRSMDELRLHPAETEGDIRRILHGLVARTGLREAYVAMDCLRGRPLPGQPFHPASCRNYLAAFVLPWVWVIPPAVQERGAHLIVSRTPRIPEACIDPKVKNFHWGDLTRALFEAHDAGADTAVLTDLDGLVTEGPGFNVFAVTDGRVVSPDRGALEGITRLSVLELCAEMGIPHAVRPLPRVELEAADEIFMATTAGGIMPASRIGGRIMGNDRPGPISTALKERFWAKRAAGWHGEPVDYGADA